MADIPTRRDAARNRELLVTAARRVFAARGPDVPLEEIARAAGVSRTTLHRHFSDREALASAVLQENVADIEARAAALTEAPDGAELLYHHLLDVQLEAPWLGRMITHETLALDDLGSRTATALAPLVAHAHATGALRPSITTQDILLTIPMAMAALAADEHSRQSSRADRARAILHRGLFTTPPPAAQGRVVE